MISVMVSIVFFFVFFSAGHSIGCYDVWTIAVLGEEPAKGYSGRPHPFAAGSILRIPISIKEPAAQCTAHTHSRKAFWTELSLYFVKMSDKVVLHYFDGRGKMESIRWLLAVAGVEVCCFGKLLHLCKEMQLQKVYID